MKKVREILYEKFTEESTDIIRDMGIGDPEIIKVYKSLDIVNDMAKGEVTGSFNLQDAFTHIESLNKLIYLTVKFHIDEKFNLDLKIEERGLEYPAAREFATAKAGYHLFRFKLNDDTNEVYISLSLVKGFKHTHLITSSRCKTLDQLDQQMKRLIKKIDVKITP